MNHFPQHTEDCVSHNVISDGLFTCTEVKLFFQLLSCCPAGFQSWCTPLTFLSLFVFFFRFVYLFIVHYWYQFILNNEFIYSEPMYIESSLLHIWGFVTDKRDLNITHLLFVHRTRPRWKWYAAFPFSSTLMCYMRRIKAPVSERASYGTDAGRSSAASFLSRSILQKEWINKLIMSPISPAVAGLSSKADVSFICMPFSQLAHWFWWKCHIWRDTWGATMYAEFIILEQTSEEIWLEKSILYLWYTNWQ